MNGFRRCRFETMEARRMLDADPLFLGGTYYEADNGSDTSSDVLEVSFVGGSETTQLSEIKVETNPILFFDTADGGDGVPEHGAFQFDEANSIGIAAEDIQEVKVSDGGKSLEIAIDNFVAGDKLVFTIDVDHDIGFNGDPIASGAEFELSQLQATFVDPNYTIDPLQQKLDLSDPNVVNNLDGTQDSVYWNGFDGNFANSGLEGILRADNFQNGQGEGQASRTAGAMIEHELTARPIKISGTVFHDHDTNLVQDAGDEGVEGVTLSLLYKENLNDSYEDVLDQNGQPATATTDSSGNYSFGDNDGLTLLPGYYRVVETQPSEFNVSVGAIPGTVDPSDGQSFGVASDSNVITDIHIPFGDRSGGDYDFAEAKAIGLAGNIHLSDGVGNCFGPGHQDHRPIEGARVYLVNDRGDVFATETDVDGNYSFASDKFPNLVPGTYTLIEVTPQNMYDGGEFVGAVDGSVNGVVDNLTEIQLRDGGVLLVSDIVADDEVGRLDFVTQIDLASDQSGTKYNFCEHEPASISGHVFVDTDDNAERAATEESVEQTVQLTLLDGDGNQVATTQTDDQGFYRFDNVAPGTYTVRQTQPDKYFDGKESVGTINGTPVGTTERTPDGDGILRDNDEITGITIEAGQHAMNYDFGEIEPSVLSGYVYHDDNNNGVFDENEAAISGVEMELRVTFANDINGVGLSSDYILDKSLLDSDGRYVIVTDSTGFYEFTGLRGGVIELAGGGILPANYTVYQNVQPSGFVDGLDTPGSTGGLPDNSNQLGHPPNNPQAQSVITTHAENGARSGDILFSIPIGIATTSTNNNFGELLTEPTTPTTPPVSVPVPVPVPTTRVVSSIVRAAPQGGSGFSTVTVPLEEIIPVAEIHFGGGAEYSWHLSVINAGTPRGDQIASANQPTFRSAAYLDRTDWQPENLRDGRWQLQFTSDDYATDHETRELLFGIRGGIPIVGDFNGDGVDEIGVYYNGEWFFDLNGNGQWDAEDLWAKLGDAKDRPVTGDWDGDGKDDIGIYGPMWSEDAMAVEREFGLPDNANMARNTPNSQASQPDKANSGSRLMRHTSQGNPRSDVIDHVFRYGVSSDIPLTGDWNGDGIHSIGVFRSGQWNLDVDGDGQWSPPDVITNFGQPGDIPVAGDWNGDGVDEIGIYRDGKWIVDSNGNHELDAADRVFELGGEKDLPVVGDWNGDGIDDPALYRSMGS